MLQISKLHFDYDNKPLLQDIHFHLPKGGLIHLKGKNGSGKTTLLKLIAGLSQPQEGEIFYCDEPISQLQTSYQRQICYQGHKSGLNPLFTAKENWLFDLHYNPLLHDFNILASVFNLKPHMDIQCGLLSAGQKRQVSLLKLWMTKASLWLLDEPFTALDDTACSTVMRHIQAHRNAGGGVILTSHQSLPLEAFEYQEYKL